MNINNNNNKNLRTHTNIYETTIWDGLAVQRPEASPKRESGVSVWYGPTSTTLQHDGLGYDVVQGPGPTSHTTSLWARLPLNVITGPVIEVKGQGGIFDVFVV